MQLIKSQIPFVYRQSGFTLIELTIVLLIFAMIVLPIMNLYKEYQMAERRTVTVERISDASSQIRIFRSSTFSYPCPADRALSAVHLNFGRADCASFAALSANSCTANGGMCKVDGSWDADGDGSKDPVLIGAIPFRDLDSINQSHMSVYGQLDGWQNKLTYAVSARTTPFVGVRNAISVGNDFKYGVITALDEHGKSTAGIGYYDRDNADADNNIETGRDGDAQFAIFSHGAAGIGAYSLEGTLVNPCNLSTVEGENCDADSVFVSALGAYQANNSDFYDDIITFYRDQAGDLWTYIENPAPGGGSTGHIRKLNLGNVGVSTGSAPIQNPLDVNGTVRAPSVLMSQLKGDICKANGTDCIPARFLYDKLEGVTITTTSGSKTYRNMCPAGEVMSAISNGQAQCSKPAITPRGVALSCSPNFLQGILTNGCIICSDGSVLPSLAACNL